MLGDMDGEIVTQLFRGPLSAVHALWPDQYTKERMRQAGVRDLEQVGTPLHVERFLCNAV